ncbi:unnamed protein product, partial [marine sediment metagenome]
MQAFNLEKLLRYLMEGLGVAIASYLISGQRYTLQEVGMIGMTAALTLFVLDAFSPGTSAGARQGTGFGLGYQTVNLPEAATTFGVPVLPGLEGFDGQSTYVLPSQAGGEGEDVVDLLEGQQCGGAEFRAGARAEEAFSEEAEV